MIIVASVPHFPQLAQPGNFVGSMSSAFPVRKSKK